MTETKPTPSEIERAHELERCLFEQMANRFVTKDQRRSVIAQALADTREQERERCAVIAKNTRQTMVTESCSDRIAAAIRKGEP